MRTSLRKAASSAVLIACLLTMAACGGGGGGGSSSGSSGGGGGTTGPDMGTVATIDDTYALKIKSASSGQYLNITGASQTAGTFISQGADGSSKDLLWHVMPMDASQYNVENLLNHQVLGIENASMTDGAKALQWADNGTNDHLWTFKRLTNSNYLIQNARSGLYLQVDGSGVVTQGARPATGTGCTCQEWQISPTINAAYPMPKAVSGTGVGVHDPNLIQDTAGTWWLYGTHNTLASSTDLVTFTQVSGGAFQTDFAWWASKNTTGGSGRTDLWAPSLMYANGKYYHYYSIPIYNTPGVAGTNNGAQAVIGLATSTSPTGPWTDVGTIIESCGKMAGCTTTFNAIDPAPYVDTAGNWWLVFGSWEDGIHVLPLDPATGLRLGTAKYDIAHRDAGEEGAFIFPWTVGGTKYYYYFASINVCCSATARYRVVVGRSTSPTGPFLDRGGLDLTNGGGTILLSAHANIKGPGGQSVVDVSGTPVLVYHYYDSNAGYAAKLGLNNLAFDAEGWPYVN